MVTFQLHPRSHRATLMTTEVLQSLKRKIKIIKNLLEPLKVIT